MFKKRLIGMVIVRNSWAIQSFGYNKYLPLGKPECIVENLDRWGVDEICLLSIDRSSNNLGPDFKLLEKIGKLGLKTPFIYGGGIKSVSDAIKVIQLCADRICVDSLLHDNFFVVKQISQALGNQAVIGVLPVSFKFNQLEWINYRSKETYLISESYIEKISEAVSEFMLIDKENEGYANSFNDRIISDLEYFNIPLILFGGLSNYKQIHNILKESKVAAVGVGNFLNYKEHAVQKFKKNIESATLRPNYFEKSY